MTAAVDREPADRPNAEFAGPSESPPARELRPDAGNPSLVASILPLAGAFALAVLVRCLSVGLPIEGDPVAYGALARSLAHGDGYSIDGFPHLRYPPGHPALLALALLFGGSVTTTTRVVGILLAGVSAALLVSIAGRLGKGKPSPALLALVAVLAAAHPSLATFAGGLVPGSEATGLVLMLGAFRLALVGSARTQRMALVLTGLLPLVRYDLVAFPLATAWLVDRVARRGETAGVEFRQRVRARAPALAVLLLPFLSWFVRTWIVSHGPGGAEHAAHAVNGFSMARVPGNLLVLAALVLPAAGLGFLWIFVPSGLRRLWDGKASDRPAVRTAFVGAALHLALVALFAEASARGDGSVAFVSESLRFGLAATPFVVLAAVAGLAARPPGWRWPVTGATAAFCVLLSMWLLSGGVQRALPFPARAAGRLHLLAEAYDAALAEAAPTDWIALDLSPRPSPGVEVFLGDRAPTRRTGVVAAARVERGEFPSAPVLALSDGLGGAVLCWLVSDLAYDGMIFTGERKDLGRGGQGIFQRVEWKPIPGGNAGSYTIHQVIRPPN